MGLAATYLSCSYAYSYYLSRRISKKPAPPSTPNLSAPYQRIPFLVVSSLVILFVLHGISAFKILLLLYINFKLHSFVGNHKLAPYLIWTINIAMLFSNEIFKGYQFGRLLPELAFLVSVHYLRRGLHASDPCTKPLYCLGFKQDKRFSGLIPGWHVTFNISMLRMVSFSLDWYWARTRPSEVSPVWVQLCGKPS